MKIEDIHIDILREQKKANKEFEKMARNLSDIATTLQILNEELDKILEGMNAQKESNKEEKFDS